MTMTTPLRKFTLTTHVTSSVGWVGALAVFFAHALVSSISQNEQIVRAAYLAMGLTAWFVILPLSLASLTTGIIQALGTAWGLFRHYWVLFKMLLTALATIILLLKLEPISYLAEAAEKTTFSSTGLVGLRTSMLIHASGGLVVLLTVVTLAIYKPQGLTRYGLRVQQQSRTVAVPGTPRWVKVFGVVLIALILLVAVMSLVGEHGPGAHMPSDG
jgi:hypothetical protein